MSRHAAIAMPLHDDIITDAFIAACRHIIFAAQFTPSRLNIIDATPPPIRHYARLMPRHDIG